MRIFAVLIQGAFSSHVRIGPAVPLAEGFYTTRWVLAPNEVSAREKAFRSARKELNKWADVRDGLVSVLMDAEKIEEGSLWRWLRGGGRGFSFYVSD